MVTGTASITTTFHVERECSGRGGRCENESESGSVKEKGFIYVSVGEITE